MMTANIKCPYKPEYVHLWPLLSVFEFELVGLNNALQKKKKSHLNVDQTTHWKYYFTKFGNSVFVQIFFQYFKRELTLGSSGLVYT